MAAAKKALGRPVLVAGCSIAAIIPMDKLKLIGQSLA
jgi:hypothetical protein